MPPFHNLNPGKDQNNQNQEMKNERIEDGVPVLLEELFNPPPAI